MKSLLICNGSIGDYEFLKSVVDESDFVVCADGGVGHLIKINKVPDLVLGDLDSISNEGLDFIKKYRIPVDRYPVMKDSTDTEIALHFLIEKKFEEITIMGAIGSRMDHTMGNILLLRELSKHGVAGRIVNENNIIYYVNNVLEIKKREGYYTSLIPLSEEGISISLKGFLYPLLNSKLELSSTRGISNEIIDDYGIIKIHSGEAIIIESKD